jgi:hypothetical protein
MKRFVPPQLFYVLIFIFSLPMFADKGPISKRKLNFLDNRNTSDVPFYYINIGPGNELDNTIANDDTVYAVTLPFNFNFYNASFSTLYISTNGWLSFNDYTTPVRSFPNNQNFINNFTSPDTLIAPYWDQLRYQASGATIDTLTVGTAPYRRFVVQYRNVNSAFYPYPLNSPMTMQVVLYESTNEIKFQYLDVGGLDGNDGTGGVRFSQGIPARKDSLLYFHNPSTPFLTSGRAVLFYPADTLSATISLDNTDVTEGTQNQIFNLSINNLQLPNASFLGNMGKADVLRIKRPNFWTSSFVVDQVVVDGVNFFILNSSSPPTEAQAAALGNIATWYFNNTTDSLYIQLPLYTVKDSIRVEFHIDVPSNQNGNFSFNTSLFARSDKRFGVDLAANFLVSSANDTLIKVTATTPTGVVNTQLNALDQFTVEVRDRNNQPVENVPISFSIIGKPVSSQNEALDKYVLATDASGQASTLLTLGTKVGTYTVRGFAANTVPNSVDFSAIATHDRPDSVLIVSSASISGQYGQAVSDSVRFRLVDQFENPIADSTINFVPLNGTVNPTSAITKTSGEAATQWTLGTTGVTQQMYARWVNGADTARSSNVTATVTTGAATALELVSLRGIAGQDSAAALAGEDVTFVVRAVDDFGNPVSGTTINFEVLGGYSAQFDNDQMVTDANGRVTNVVTTDSNNDSTFFRALISGVDTLDIHLFYISYVANSLSPAVTAPGASVGFTLQVRNYSPRTVTLNTSQTLFSFSQGSNQYSVALVAGSPITPGVNTLQFATTTISSSFPNISYTPQLKIKGSGSYAVLNGTILLPPNSLQLFDVDLSLSSLTPTSVTKGRGATFTAQLSNTGSGDVTLLPGSSFMAFGSDTVYLDQSYAVPGGGSAVTVRFQTNQILSNDNSLAYPLNVVLSGSRNGIPFDTTFSSVGTGILVQRVPNVVVNSIVVSPDTVSPGKDSVQVTLRLRNSGSNRATATVDLANDISLATGQLSNIKPTSSTTISLPANTTSSDIVFYFNVASSYPLGTDSAIATYRFVDANSAVADTVTASGSPGVFEVVSKANLSILNASVTPQLVKPGQAGVQLSFTVQNSGVSTAVIDDGDVSVTFNNGHTLTRTAPVSLPVVVAGSGGQTTFAYNLTVSNSSAIGYDPFDVTISYRDSFSGVNYTTVSTDLDSLNIRQALAASQLQIQKVTAPAQVVRGQSGISASVRLKNLSDVAIRVDSLLLVPGNSGISSVLQTSLPVTILAGDTAQFLYTLNISSGVPTGTSSIDARFKATELQFGDQLSDTGAVTPASVTVFAPASLSFSNISVLPDTVGEGQSGIIYSARLTNGTSSNVAVQLDTVFLTIGVGGDSISAKRTSPVILPITLSGGQTQLVQFQLSTADSTPSGSYALQAVAQGTENITGTARNATASSVNLVVRETAQLTPTAISVTKNSITRDSVYIGQENLRVTVTVQNNGAGPADLNNVTLVLKDQSNNDLGYPVQMVTTGLPVTLSSGSTTDVVFRLDIPDNLVVNNFPVLIGATVSGKDGTSGNAIADTVNQLKTIRVFSAPNITVLSFPGAINYNPGDAATLQLRVRNSGSTPLVLSSSTQLVLKKTTDLTTIIPISIDLSNSPSVIAANSDTTLQFNTQVLNTTGTFRLDLDVFGSAFGDSKSYQNLTDGSTIKVGNSANLTSILSLVPSTVSIADTVEASLTLTNNSMTNFQLDGGDSTRLELRYADNNQLLSITTTRLDTITMIPATGVPVTIRWRFVLPLAARAGNVNTTAFISLNNGDITDSAVDLLTIETGVNISYLEGSLSPDSVIPGQKVKFNASFVNTGSTPLIVDATQSYFRFTDGSTTFNANVSGTFSILGDDTSTIAFTETTIPANFNIGNYIPTVKLYGTLPNADTLTGFDNSLSDNVNIIQSANVKLDSIRISPTLVTVGAENVEVRYYLSNTGQSTAHIRTLSSVFVDNANNVVSNLWSQQSQLPGLVDTLSAGDTVMVKRLFSLTENLQPGDYRGRMQITYNDVRTPGTIKTFNNSLPEDTITVVGRATLQFTGQIIAPAGAIDRTVSTGQSFTWRLGLTLKPGSGNLIPGDSTTIFMDFRNKGFYFDQNLSRDTMTVRMFPDQNRDIAIWAGNTSRAAVLSAVITDTSLVSDGVTKALIAGSNTTSLEMEIQNKAALAIAIDGPGVVGSDPFTVQAVVTNQGTSGVQPDSATILLNFDNGRFNLTSGSTNRRVKIGQTVFYNFTTIDTTAGSEDIIASISQTTLPQDTNTTASAAIAVGSDTLSTLISTDAVNLTAAINSPAGAVDGIVSTGQSFVINADFVYKFVQDTGRVAILSLPAGYSTTNDTIAIGVNSGKLNWTVFAPVTTAATDSFAVTLIGYRDVGGGTIQKNTKIVKRAVTTVEKAKLSIMATIVSPLGAQDGVVSSGQNFGLRVLVNNSGVAGTIGANTVLIDLPAGYLPGDTTLQLNTGVADTLQLTAPLTASSLSSISATLSSAATDENTNSAASIITAQRDLGIQTVRRADLALSMSAPDSFSTNTAGLPLTLQVTNLGSAAVSSDSIPVVVTLDPSVLRFSAGNSAASDTFNVKVGGSRQLSLVSLSQTGLSDILGEMVLSGITDENTNSIAYSSIPSDTAQVRVVSSGLVSITNFEISAPAGARDNTLSTGQSFTLSATARFAGNLVSGTRSVRLSLPPGSGFSSSSPLEVAVGSNGDSTITWQIVAPSDTLLRMMLGQLRGENISGKRAFDFTLRASGKDGSSGTTLQALDTLSVNLVEKAKLSIASAIEAPAGAIDRTLSTTQFFDVWITVANLGTAATLDSNTITLSIPPGYQLVSGNSTFKLATTDTARIRLRAPNVVHSDARNLGINLSTPATDENSNKPAQVLNSNATIAGLRTEKRANLILSMSTLTEVSFGRRNIPLTIKITNNGDAGVTPDSLPVTVNIDTNFVKFSDDSMLTQRTVFVTVNGSKQLLFHSIGDTGSTQLDGSMAIAGIQDVNNNYPDTTVFASKTTDAASIIIKERGKVRVLGIAVVNPPGATDGTLSTGQAFTLQARVQFGGNLLENSRKVKLVLPTGFTTNTPLEQPGDAVVDTLSWSILAPSNLNNLNAAEYLLKVVALAQDTSGSGTIQPDTSAINITVVTAARLSMRARIQDPPGARDAIFSTGQPFLVILRVNNNGQAQTMPDSMNRVEVTLPQGYSFNGNGGTIIRTIATNVDDSLLVLAPSQPAGPDTIDVVLSAAAPDINTNEPAAIDVAERDISGLRTVSRANLQVSLSVEATFSTLRDSLPVSVSVTNLGQAGITTDQLSVAINIDTTFFEFSDRSPDSVKLLTFNFVNGAGDTLIYLNSKNTSGPTPISAVLLTDGVKDENNNFPDSTVSVAVGNVVRSVNVLPSASVDISQIRISAPVPNADSVSTGQQFTVEATINFSGNIAPQGRAATIVLPAGFTPLSDTTKILQPGQSVVSWDVLAPGAIIAPAEKSSEKNTNITADLFDVTVKARGVDAGGGSGPQPTDQDNRQYTLVSRAQMSLFSEITAPTGALDGTISTEQPFDLRIWVEKNGEAFTSDSNYVTVTVPQEFRIGNGSFGDSLKIKLGNGFAAAKTLRIFSGATIPASQPFVTSRLDSAAIDKNRNKRADILQKTSRFAVSVVSRAELSVDSIASNIDVATVQQPFLITARVVNNGSANVQPNDSVYVRLVYDNTQFTLLNGSAERSRRLINKNAEFSWQLQANTGSTPDQYVFTAELIPERSQDENNNYPGSFAVIVDTSDSDTLQIVENAEVSIAAAYFYQPDSVDITASSQQQIQLFVQPQLIGQFSFARIAVRLPKPFFAQDSLTADLVDNSTLQWTLNMPDTTSNGMKLPFIVEMRAKSAVNGALLNDVDTLFITLQKRALLQLSASLVENLYNNVISHGDTVTLRAVVTNLGEAGVLNSPSGELTLSLGNNLTLVDNETPVKPFQINQPIEWRVYADPNSAVSGLLKSLDERRSEKYRLLQQTSMQQVDESADGLRLAEIERDITGLIQQINAFAEPSHLTARITRRSIDANSGLPAPVVTDSARSNVLIAEPVSVSIVSMQIVNETTALPQDTVSTEQTFDVVVATDFAGEVVEKRGTLSLPAGFTFVDGDSVRVVNAAGNVRWKVKAPENVAGTETFELQVSVQGINQNSDPQNPEIVSATHSTPVITESKSQLQLHLPVVSYNLTRLETFAIQTVVRNIGESDVEGSGRIRLSIQSPSFTLDSSTPAEQSFTIDPNVDSVIVSWLVTAPNGNISTIANIDVLQLPKDEHTAKPSSIDLLSRTIDINMIPTRLELSLLPEVATDISYKAGQQNLPIIGIRVFNLNPEEAIFINELSIRVSDPGSTLPVSDITNLLLGMEVVTYTFWESNPNGDASPPSQLSATAINGDEQNPVTLVFDPPLIVSAGTGDSLVLRIDLAKAAINRNFHLAISNLKAKDGANNPVEILDVLGTPIINSNLLVSAGLTILSDNAEQVFRNYPNPFGKDSNGGTGRTYFSFVMQSGGDATLSIYTLSGKLVYRQTATGLDGGGKLYNRVLFWDGKNSQGKTVVNGVYIAILDANGQKYTTRVAYIK